MGAVERFTKAGKNEEELAAFLPYANHVTKNAVKLKNGDYVATIRMQGAAHESADALDINIWHDQLNHYLRNIASPNVALWTHVVRRRFGEYPEGEFSPGFARDLNEKYRAHMASQRNLVNELYLSIVYRPDANAFSRAVGVFSAWSKKTGAEARAQQLEELEALSEVVSASLAALDRYEPELLGCYEFKGQVFSEVCEFLAFLINGEWRRFGLGRAELSETLPSSRPFFGKGGLLSIKGPTSYQYGAIIGIQEYPSITVPGIWNGLLSMPFEFVFSQSFRFITKPNALGQMKRQFARMVNAGDVAGSQVAEIEDAMDDLVANRFVMGGHDSSLHIRSRSLEELKDFISEAGASLSDAGIKWARADVGIAAAFLAQLPGNHSFSGDGRLITSRNFAAFSCFHNYPIGRIRNNQWGPAVTMFRTTSGSPYYFNFHAGEPGSDAKRAARLDPNHKDLANTIVVGQAGSGKTVLETFLLTQMMKFNRPDKPMTAVLFDKDLGASVAVLANGGRYYPLRNGTPTGFNPFQMDPTPRNIGFLDTLVRRLAHRENQPFTSKQEDDISTAVRGVMNAPKAARRLRSVLQFLPHGEPDGILARLQRWAGPDAPLNWLFDNAEDTLSIGDSPVVGFDVTEFLTNPETRTPTIMYLFHRVEGLLDGRRVPIWMDEFGELLNDKAFEDLSRNKLVTIRKQNGFLTMLTQSPQQVLQNP
ncbi:MAG: VirB4 family type IV secretion/conjugal transfer ATPase, partial [Ramlibacter sp.]|nr:VirB4 family type IV secretion/conjugal transfer ATPase [Ramlibacter sp.]